MYRLSVCADTVFLELPFEERVKKIADAGFLVEFWGWKGRDLSQFEQIQLASFSATQNGSLVHPEDSDTYVAGVAESTGIAKQINSPTLIIHSGELGEGGKVTHRIPTNPVTHWITAYKSLCKIAELGKANNIIYCLEILNTKVDHPGYSINIIENAVNLVKEVNSPRIKILFDIYHTSLEEGNVAGLLRAYHQYIGHVHIADVPGRHEPGTGEINYPFLAKVLREVGYEGAVGMEAFPLENGELALKRFRAAFAQ
jgi:hydroxypyruvate isomerase